MPNLFRRLVGEGAREFGLRSCSPRPFTGRARAGGSIVGAASRVFAAALLILCAVGVLTSPLVVPLMTPGFSGPKLALTTTLTRLMPPICSLPEW
jgi:peptidoglycan biosynthesis protein MviN/MurJ (putative lipid II flippase)